MDDYVVLLTRRTRSVTRRYGPEHVPAGSRYLDRAQSSGLAGKLPDAANGHRVTTAWVDGPSRVYRVLVPVQVFPSRGCRIYVSHWCGLTSVAANSLLHRYAVDTGT